MTRRWTRLAVLCVAILVTACASPARRPEEAPLPGQRIFQRGYSFVPPDEKGWAISQRDTFLVSLAKRVDDTNEIVLVWGAVFKLPEFTSEEEFVRIVSDALKKDTDSVRFRLLKHEVTPGAGKGTTCARSHELVEDSQALTEAGNRVYMLREMVALTCAHPKDKRIGVRVMYSHRYYTGRRDPQLLEKASAVLNSVEFAEISG